MLHATVTNSEQGLAPEPSAPTGPEVGCGTSDAAARASAAAGAAVDLRAGKPAAGDVVSEAARGAAAHVARGRAAFRYSPRPIAPRADAAPESSPVLADRLAQLRATVTAYVGRRRSEGTPIQRVLPEVKVLVRGATARAVEREATEALVAQVVRWTIEAYLTPSAG